MKIIGRILLPTTAALIGALGVGQAHACTPTGFFRDGINLTAELIATGDVTDQTINATGCNIGIFYGPGGSGTVDNVEVFGANYFGIVVAGDLVDSSNNSISPGATSVDITQSTIQDIGENPFNGTQHGVAVYYHACAAGSSATGSISDDLISLYQKGGIVVNCPGAAATISGNTVTGNGPVPYIAQNGIQIGFGATGQIMRNKVTGNSYSGTNDASSAGILMYSGCGTPLSTGVQIVKNVVGDATPADGSDVGIFLVNLNPACTAPPSTATSEKVINNTLVNTEVTNVSGDFYPIGYQAGIFDGGLNDKLIHNSISGAGYVPAANPCTVPASTGTEVCPIDTGDAAASKVHANSYAFGP